MGTSGRTTCIKEGQYGYQWENYVYQGRSVWVPVGELRVSRKVSMGTSGRTTCRDMHSV